MYTSGFSRPYYTSTQTSVDTRYDVALHGRGFMVDWAADRFRRTSVAMIRQQADSSDRPGEASLNPEGLWRRTQESWHHGAGQSWLDKADSSPFRYRSSKGVDPWDKYSLSLLPAVAQPASDAYLAANTAVTVAGGYLYVAQGASVRRRNTTGGAWTDLTGEPGNDVTSIASDGVNVYAAFGTQGILSGTTVLGAFATGTVTLVRYAKGRLFAAHGPNLYNLTTGGALPTALYEHDNTQWQWTDVTAGRAHVYASGYVGDKSLIYRIGVKEDGTGLDVPIPAAELPDGEVASCVHGYLGYLVIGTSKGVRFAATDDIGNVTLGALTPTPGAVLCAEGQDRFVWFGWSDFDATSTGLGRLDLTQFTSPLTPAYASDLMAPVPGDVTSVVTFADRLVFTVSGSGVWTQSDSTVSSGTVTTGRASFGIVDDKTAVYVDATHAPLPDGAAITLSVAADDGPVVAAGTRNVPGSTRAEPFSARLATGGWFEMTATLTGGAQLRSLSLRADPGAERTQQWIVPLLLRCVVDLPGNVPESLDVAEALRFITGLRDSRQPVTYQELGDAWRVVVDDTEWAPENRHHDHHDGVLTVKLKGL